MQEQAYITARAARKTKHGCRPKGGVGQSDLGNPVGKPGQAASTGNLHRQSVGLLTAAALQVIHDQKGLAGVEGRPAHCFKARLRLQARSHQSGPLTAAVHRLQVEAIEQQPDWPAYHTAAAGGGR